MINEPISFAVAGDKTVLAPCTIAGERMMFQWNGPALLRIAEAFKKSAATSEVSLSSILRPDEVVRPQPSLRKPCEPTKIPDQGWWLRRDLMAWYVPAHNRTQDYGVHFDVPKIRALAELLKNHASTDAVTEDEWLVTAILTCFWHEVGHAWIEDLVTIAEDLVDAPFYVQANSAYKCYIFKEEAICNSSATGMLEFFWQSHPHRATIMESVLAFMKSQEEGYRDYVDLTWWSANQQEFQRAMEALLHDVYGVPDDVAAHGIRCYFDPSEHTFPSWRLSKRRQGPHVASQRMPVQTTALYMDHDAYPLFCHFEQSDQVEQLAAMKDKLGRTAQHYAIQSGHLDHIEGSRFIAQLPGPKDKYGKTAMDAAVENGNLIQAFGKEPLDVWVSLTERHQELVRDALKEKNIPEKLAQALQLTVNADQPKAWESWH